MEQLANSEAQFSNDFDFTTKTLNGLKYTAILPNIYKLFYKMNFIKQ